MIQLVSSPACCLPRDLAILDEYMLRVMGDMLKAEGPTSSGLYGYYQSRIESGGHALSDYDRFLFDFIADNFDRGRRRIVHAGCGLGTLAFPLAMAGYKVIGVERDQARYRAASRMRCALAEAWPEATQTCELMLGEYPVAVDRTSWLSAETVLVFTNCEASWAPPLTDTIIASLRACGDVILDARLFGGIRDSAEERTRLIRTIEAAGLVVAPIRSTPPGTFYHHARPSRERA
jgi:hypothetical protein